MRNRHHHLGADVSRRNGIDGDAVSRDLERQRLGKAMHAGLGSGVVRLSEGTLLAIDRRDVDNPPPLALDHAIHDLLGHVENTVEVGRHHRIPIRLGHLLEGHVAGNTGIVHQYVHRAYLGSHLFDACLAGVEIGDIAGKRLEAISHVVHGLQPVACLGVAGRVRCHDAIPQRGKLDADCLTKTTHTTCYKCHSSHVFSSPLTLSGVKQKPVTPPSSSLPLRIEYLAPSHASARLSEIRLWPLHIVPALARSARGAGCPDAHAP